MGRPTKKTTKNPAVLPFSKTESRPTSLKKSPRLYSLIVELIGGPASEEFLDKNPKICRTIQIPGNQTLEDLHLAIFDAFGRFDDHLYEYQFGKKPMDRDALRYVTSMDYEMGMDEGGVGGSVEDTKIESLMLKEGQVFFYWFDFGDDWWHKIKVQSIADDFPKGKYPQVTDRVGDNPPQYEGMDEDEEEDDDD